MSTNERQTALITGASSGIGRELARLFARAGYGLVLVARNQQKLAALAEELKDANQIPVAILPTDLAEATAAARLVASLRDAGLTVDILVNNAGTQVYAPFAEASLTELSAMLQVNIATLMELTHLLLPGMIARGQGRILNLGSTGSYVPGPLNAVYCASKAFVLSFSEAIAAELDGTGVTVTALCPGATKTEFIERHGMGKVRLFKNTMTPEAVALIGYRALMGGKRSVVAGCSNKLQVFSFKLLGPFLPLFPNRLVMSMGRYYMGEVE